jgi:N-acetylmuramoyl-L-alanine amidase
MKKFNITLFKLTAILLLFGNLCFSQNTPKFIVTLDAGHGDQDFGAVYHGHIEKNIALGVVLKVGKILEKNPNITVVYTKKTDVFVDLIERANIANRANANIFVSIHCNANKNQDANGSETYVMGMSKNASNLEAAKKENSVVTLEKDYKKKYEGFNPNEPESMIGMTLLQEEYMDNSISLAGKIQNNFVERIGQKNRGVKQAPFMVLHKAYMPRVLIEMGFISNKEEGARLDSEDGQEEIAASIAQAIVSYKNEFFGEGPNEPKIITPPRYQPKVEPEKVVETVQEVIVVPAEETKAVVSNNGVVFKVQLSVSSKNLSLIPANFKGLNNISTVMSGSNYKYMYGETNSFDEAKKLQKEAIDKGYKEAFIIAFKDGKSISISDALK